MSAALVGKPVVDMLGALLSERDFEIVAHRIRTHPPDGPKSGGRLWCRLRTARGSEVPAHLVTSHFAKTSGPPKKHFRRDPSASSGIDKVHESRR